jgi:cell division protease FtsH
MFLGRDMGHGREYSETVAERVDVEVRALIEQAHNEAYEVLNANRDILDRLALALLEKETLDHVEIAEIFQDVKKLPPRAQWLSSDGRPVSAKPPIEIPRPPVSAGIAASTESDDASATEKPARRRPSGQARPATA